MTTAWPIGETTEFGSNPARLGTYNRRMSPQLLSAILLVTMFGRDDTQPQRTPISVALACEDSQRMTVTIRNGGTADTAVIFGVVLANGSKYLVDDMTMQVTTGSGRVVEQYKYHPRHYPSGIAGRVDDWIVPLPAGASYSLTLAAADFIVGANQERRDSFPPDALLSLRLPIRGPTEAPNLDVTGLRLFRVWTGSTMLRSNDIAISERCR